MSMLAGLRAATPADVEEPPWETFRRVMPLLVPGFETTKMEVFSGGRVGVRARSPLRGVGRYYIVTVLDAVVLSLEDGRRTVRTGISKYRDEADAMIYDRPFAAHLEPQPGVVAVWLAGLLLTEEPHSENRLGGGV